MTGIQAHGNAPAHSALLAARRRAALMTKELVQPALGEGTPSKGKEAAVGTTDNPSVQFKWDHDQGILSVQHRDSGRTLYQVQVQRGDVRPDEIMATSQGGVDFMA